MSTGFHLLDHPNPHGENFYRTRRSPKIYAVVVHITAGLEDLDAFADHSAEKTAEYASSTDRPVSWHSGSDTDTALDLLPPGFTAFHCKGYNSTTLGHEISKTSPDWRVVPEHFIDATLRRAAAHLAPKAKALGIPARHATKAELDHAIATGGDPVGFIGHEQLDPARRKDPGRVKTVDTFPWHRFLPLLEEDDDMAMTPEQIEEMLTLLRSINHQLSGDARLKAIAADVDRTADKLVGED